MLELAQELIRIPSVSNETGVGVCERPIQELVVSQLKAIDAHVDEWIPDNTQLETNPFYHLEKVDFSNRPNVVGTIKGSGGGRSIILNVHIDTQHPGLIELWDDDPWSGVIKDGRLYGRGSVDTKTNLAIVIHLFKLIRRLGIRLKGDVVIESVMDEEYGGAGTLSARLRGYTADAGIVLEPTSLQACPTCRGVLAFKLRVKGKGAHPCASYLGVSAIEKMMLILQALSILEKERQQEFRTKYFERYPVFLPIVIGRIRGDESALKVPEICEIEGLIGTDPSESLNDVKSKFEDYIQAVANTDEWLKEHKPIIEWFGLAKEGGVPIEDPEFTQIFADAFKRITGRDLEIVGLTSSTDLHYMTNYAKIPTLVFGPGDLMRAHSSNEYIEIGEVITAAKVLAGLLTDWCGVSD